jgi:hypothetical protein
MRNGKHGQDVHGSRDCILDMFCQQIQVTNATDSVHQDKYRK